jgi:hypothetical protein
MFSVGLVIAVWGFIAAAIVILVAAVVRITIRLNRSVALSQRIRRDAGIVESQHRLHLKRRP